jgi:hypothetical protein
VATCRLLREVYLYLRSGDMIADGPCSITRQVAVGGSSQTTSLSRNCFRVPAPASFTTRDCFRTTRISRTHFAVRRICSAHQDTSQAAVRRDVPCMYVLISYPRMNTGSAGEDFTEIAARRHQGCHLED